MVSEMKNPMAGSRPAPGRRRWLAVAVLPLLLATAGCETGRDKEIGGTLLGAALGGFLGSQIGGGTGRLVATGAGVFLGGFLGQQIGRQLDEKDRLEAELAAQRALETSRAGETIAWNNPDSGASGSITPTRTYQRGDNQYCREYQQTVTVGGQTQDAYGTACRQPDGSWKIQS